MRVVGDPAAQATSASIIATLPTGGWLKSDGSDVAVQNAAGQPIPVSVLSHNQLGDTIIQFKRIANDKWYWAYAVNPAAPLAQAEPIKEGLVGEFRDWAGDKLDSWANVVGGLKKSENVIGNAVVSEVNQNCNPARPDNPRNFAASYRGYLDIKAAGVYRFYVNADDAAFLFIDGFKVFEQVGQNQRLTGQLETLRRGRHRPDRRRSYHRGPPRHRQQPQHLRDLHTGLGPAGSKAWAYVPIDAFAQSMLATTADVEESAGGQVAVSGFGMDDTLTSNGTTIYLTRFEAQGQVRDPAKLQWNFGDGTTGTGRSPQHVYFQGGAYKVTLKSSDGLPAFTQIAYVWPAPTTTSPLSLSNAVQGLASCDWQKLDRAKILQMFGYLMICEQPNRWPLVEAVTRYLLSQSGVDPEVRVQATTSLMEAMAEQGRGADALKLGDAAVKEFTTTPSLEVNIELEAAWINHRHLYELSTAAKQYQAIIEEHRRLGVPEVRLAAIRLGDLYTETGDLAKAGEAYRMAGTLGGEGFKSTAQSDAITRGAMLRVAEQKLRSGDVHETQRILEKIEIDYPEQKLEGLYRFLRAEADRVGGRYEEAIRNYEVLLKLTQWAGFRDRALFGMADTYYRMGDYGRALEWLGTIETSFPAFYEKEKLSYYQQTIRGRVARAAAATQPSPTGDSSTPNALFAGFQTGFEPDEKNNNAVIVGWSVVPGLQMMGSHVGLLEAVQGAYVMATYSHRIRNLTSNGYYWVEIWCREVRNTLPATSHMYAWLYGTGNDLDAQGTALDYIPRGYGQWEKLGFLLKTPVTQDGRFEFSIRQVIGAMEIDSLSILPVSDRQHDALSTFVEGSRHAMTQSPLNRASNRGPQSDRTGLLAACGSALLLLTLFSPAARPSARDVPPAESKPPPPAKSPPRTESSAEDTSLLPDAGPTQRKTQDRQPPPPTTLTVMYKVQYGSTLQYVHPDGTIQTFEQWKSYPNDAYNLVTYANQRISRRQQLPVRRRAADQSDV